MLWGPFSPRLTSVRWAYYLQLFIKKTDAGISYDPAVKTLSSNVGGEILPLAGELIRAMPHSMAKNTEKKRKWISWGFGNVLKVTVITSNEVKWKNRSF